MLNRLEARAITVLRHVSPPVSVAAVIGAYQYCYAFSYFPVTEGWFSTYAMLIRTGAIPYRDFPFLMPPLYPLQLAVGQAILGDSIVVARFAGVCLTCGIGIVLWAILCEFFPRWTSAFSAVVATIYYQSGVAFIGYDFTQVVTFCVLSGALLLIYDIRSNSGRQVRWVDVSAAFWAGLFLMAAALTKQSNGVLAELVLSCAFVCFLLRSETRSNSLRRMLHFLVGSLVLILPILLWLGLFGALGSMYQQIVNDALVAKGGGGQIFSGWLIGFFGSQGFAEHVAYLLENLAILLGLSLGPRFVAGQLGSSLGMDCWIRWARSWESRWSFVGQGLIAVLGLLALFFVIAATWKHGALLSRYWQDQGAVIYNNIILFAVPFYAVGLAITIFLVATNPTPKRGSALVLFAVGVGLTLGNGTSAGLSEISAFVGVAVALAFLIKSASPLLLTALPTLVISLLLSAFLIERKFESPYAWWSVKTEDVRQNKSCVTANDLTQYLCMEPGKHEVIDMVVAKIRETSKKGDRLFVFPHMPIFNLLSDRLPYKNVVVSWFDFTSQATGKSLVEALRLDPPKLVLMGRIPDEVFAAHERLFLAGRPSVQREIRETLDAMIADGHLVKVGEFEVDHIAMELLLSAE